MTENTMRNVKRKRSPEQKYGKYKWLKMLIRRNSEELREIKRMLKGISRGLAHLMDFDSEYLIGMVCEDSRDEAILDLLLSVGSDGLPPREIHVRLKGYGLKYHHISRRINRMNKRMKNEIGYRVADKVGMNWALSDFMLRSWSAKKSEIEKQETAGEEDFRE